MADGKMSQVLKEDLKQDGVNDSRLFDLALQNMLKRAIASGIVEQNKSESKKSSISSIEDVTRNEVSVVAEVKPAKPPVIKASVIANVKPITDLIKDSVAIDGERELGEENSSSNISGNEQSTPTDGEIYYLFKTYRQFSSPDSNPYVPPIPKKNEDNPRQKNNSTPSDEKQSSKSNGNKDDKTLLELIKQYYKDKLKDKNEKELLDKIVDGLQKVYNLGEENKKSGLYFSDIGNNYFGPKVRKVGKLVDEVIEKINDRSVTVPDEYLPDFIEEGGGKIDAFGFLEISQKIIEGYEDVKSVYEHKGDERERFTKSGGIIGKNIADLFYLFGVPRNSKGRFILADNILKLFFLQEFMESVGEALGHKGAETLWDSQANKASETPNLDPLVLDLSGDGFKPTSLDKGVHFDLDGNGFAERINWIQGDDALLVLDKNGDGVINDGNELFGDRYRLANGKLARFGFEALMEQDTNGDKVIDDKDANYSRLQVWQDVNQNGISEKEELRSLSQAGVAAIQLNYQKSQLGGHEEVIFGNSAKFIKTNGETGDATEYWVKKRGYDTKILNDIVIPLEVRFLPNVAGSGNMPSLHQAMAMDVTGQLKDKVGRFILSRDVVERRQLVESILTQMAGAQNTASNSRGTAMDAKQLQVIEALLGRDYTGTSGANPHASSASILKDLYQKMVDYYYYAMMSSSHLSGVAPLIQVKEDKVIDLELLKSVLPGYLKVKDGIQLGDVAGYLKHMENQGISGYQDFKTYFGSMSHDYLKAIMIGAGEVVMGSDKGESLQATEKQAFVMASGGDDNVQGDKQNNILDGGLGNDVLNGGDGDDTYIFGLGYGHDTISDGYGRNKIKFINGIRPSDLQTYTSGSSDIVIKVKGTEDQLTLKYFRSDSSNRNFIFEFDDGTVLDQDSVAHPLRVIQGTDGDDSISAYLKDMTIQGESGNDWLYGSSGADKLYGGAGNDSLSGYDGNDLLDGGSGNDKLSGGAGDDTYIFDLGHGQDTISDYEGLSTIRFGEGIALADLQVSHPVNSSWSTVLTNTKTGDSITFSNFRYSASYRNLKLVFSDGTELGVSDEGSPFRTLYGTSESEYLSSPISNMTIYAGTGNDTLNGSSGSDKLYGDKGNDELNGGDGNDLLDGGSGNDKLSGGAGDDTYIFNLGHGQDTISDYEGLSTIRFGEGISPEKLRLAKSDNWNLSLTLGDDQLILNNYFYSSSYRNVRLEFSDKRTATVNDQLMTLDVKAAPVSESVVTPAVQAQTLVTLVNDVASSNPVTNTSPLPQASTTEIRSVTQSQLLVQEVSALPSENTVSAVNSAANTNTNLFTEQLTVQ